MPDRMLATNAAKWFIKRAADSDDALTNMKLQKLLYYAHGFSLARYGTGISRSQLQAWEHGPVAPEQYTMFSAFAKDPIPGSIAGHGLDLPVDTATVLEDVWASFGSLSAAELRRRTHRESPWRNSYIDGLRELEIPDQLMADYFRTVPAAIGGTAEVSPLARKLEELRRCRAGLGDRDSRGDLTEMLGEHREFDDVRLRANSAALD